MAKTEAWTRKEGKNPSGGLNEKSRSTSLINTPLPPAVSLIIVKNSLKFVVVV